MASTSNSTRQLHVVLINHGVEPMYFDISPQLLEAADLRGLQREIAKRHRENCQTPCPSNSVQLKPDIWVARRHWKYGDRYPPNPELWQHAGVIVGPHRKLLKRVLSASCEGWPLHLLFAMGGSSLELDGHRNKRRLVEFAHSTTIETVGPRFVKVVLHIEPEKTCRAPAMSAAAGDIFAELAAPGSVAMPVTSTVSPAFGRPLSVFQSPSATTRTRIASHLELRSQNRDSLVLRQRLSHDLAPDEHVMSCLVDLSAYEWPMRRGFSFESRFEELWWQASLTFIRKEFPTVKWMECPPPEYRDIMQATNNLVRRQRTNARMRFVVLGFDETVSSLRSASLIDGVQHPALASIAQILCDAFMTPLAAGDPTEPAVVLIGSDVRGLIPRSARWPTLPDSAAHSDLLFAAGITADDIARLLELVLAAPVNVAEGYATEICARADQVRPNSCTSLPEARHFDYGAVLGFVTQIQRSRQRMVDQVGEDRLEWPAQAFPELAQDVVEPSLLPVTLHALITRIIRGRDWDKCIVTLAGLCLGRLYPLTPVSLLGADADGLLPMAVGAEDLTRELYSHGLVIFRRRDPSGSATESELCVLSGPRARKTASAIVAQLRRLADMRDNPGTVFKNYHAPVDIDPLDLPRVFRELMERRYDELAPEARPDSERIMQNDFMDILRTLALLRGIPMVHFAQQELLIYNKKGEKFYIDINPWDHRRPAAHVVELKTMPIDRMVKFVVHELSKEDQDKFMMLSPAAKSNFVLEHFKRVRITMTPEGCAPRSPERDAAYSSDGVIPFQWGELGYRYRDNDSSDGYTSVPVEQVYQDARSKVNYYVKLYVGDGPKIDERLVFVPSEELVAVYPTVLMLVGGGLCCVKQEEPQYMKRFPMFLGVSPVVHDTPEAMQRVMEHYPDVRVSGGR
ncbi:hypothetical protein AURDEDRAFT_153908 [Auricularia subglabra TFB-10046 SS5]|nr:hypothetical protein AURDEDRAFT_153908 [Auricularia subglabra TFB-10046 SS5]